MITHEIKVPNIGDVSKAKVIEVLVTKGQEVKADDSLITLESDKASMDIPSPMAGVIEKLDVKVGDSVSEGTVIALLSTPNEIKKEAVVEKTPESIDQPVKKEKSKEKTLSEQTIRIPDMGDAKNVDVIEILVKPGDVVEKEQSLVTLEGEKATMEIPSPYAGEIKSILIKTGSKVSKGDDILTMLANEEGAPARVEETVASSETKPLSSPAHKEVASKEAINVVMNDSNLHAGPAVRRLARELGVDLQKVTPTGPKNRIVPEDIHLYVKSALAESAQSSRTGFALPSAPAIDFSKYGEIEKIPLTKIKKLTGVHVHQSWITIPHVTQFGQADITDLESFRKSKKDVFEKQNIKLTPLVFIMKAVVAALKEYPYFNSSLAVDGENIILKKYFNLGIAVDTPQGLVVPVIKNVDKKGMVELAQELGQISQKAREKGLSPADMSGGCFTISSLGGIGGTAFTPIVNAPDVAILGVSKAAMMPVYEKGQFIPRLMLPLSLSYDHRVIDGAQGAHFMVHLTHSLSDIRTLLF